jgi:hypothetical protein
VPAQTVKRRTGLKARTPRVAVPLPGVGGYDYPRGPYGATGFPGSTPAAPKTHTQGPDGRDDRGGTNQSVTAQHAEWALLPTRRPNGTPRQPYARTHRGEHAGTWTGETGPEQRSTPVVGGAPGSQNVRNTYAQRYKARPELVRAYRASANPGKTGARLDGPSRYHPGTFVHGHPDGKPVPGMAPQPGYPPFVTVQSRFVSSEGAQEGYAVNRPLMFAKGGVAPYPSSYVAASGNQHLRGGRLTGNRYFGALVDQQQIGLPTDSYGIARARGPRHRPVSFEQPAPWTANYYDQAPATAPPADMIRQSPARPRSRRSVRRG